MKNLKVNTNFFKKGKMVLLSMSVATIITITGCSLVPNGDRARYTNDNKQSSYSDVVSSFTSNNDIQNQINLNNYNISMKNIPTGELNRTKIKFTTDNYNQLNNFLSNLSVLYDYENLYNFSENLNKYNNLNLTNKHDSKLKEINESQLFNLILENNSKYKETVKTSIYKQLSNKEIKELISLMVETINNTIKSNSDISYDRIKCVLSDLKIFKQTSSVANAFVTDDNCLIISPNMLEVATLINGKGTEKDVFIHEIIHLLQKGCNCDLENNSNLKRNFGPSYAFNDAKVNSLDFTWLYEASAEKNMVNTTNHKPLVYQNMIGYLESLSLVNIFRDNYKVKDTENLSYKRSLNDLYNYFDANTENEQKEILNLMYSIEVMQQAPNDFYVELEKSTGKKADSYLIDEVNYTVKSSICETLTKLFYKNLSKNIINKDVTLEDIFYLISLFENDLNSHIKYKDFNKYKYNERFINTYLDIQDNFFYQLSKSNNISQEEIENKFNIYNSYLKNNNGDIIPNYNLNFLSQDKREYLESREKAINLSATTSIRNILKEFSKNNLKKVYN